MHSKIPQLIIEPPIDWDNLEPEWQTIKFTKGLLGVAHFELPFHGESDVHCNDCYEIVCILRICKETLVQ